MCEMVGQFIQKKHEEEQAANARYWKISAWYDEDDKYNFTITPNEPVDSLIMRDEHPDTVLATGFDKFIKSSVENLVPNPSESEGENECHVPACFTTFSNILFDTDYDFYLVDDQSLSDEDFPKEIYSNLLFDEEFIYMKIDPHHFNAESDLVESLLNHDSFIISSSSKIDSLFDVFAGELTLLKSIPSGIDETDCYPEEETHLFKEIVDSNSFMEEIDLSFTPDDPMPPSIEEDDYDSEKDILILEELFDNYSLSLPENESFHFDTPSSSRPPAKPPDGNTKILNIKMMGDISEQKPSAKCPMMIHGKNTHILDVPLFHFYPFDQFKYGGISDDSDSEGDNLFLERLLHDDPIPLPETLDFSNVVRVFLPFFTYPVTSLILLSSGSEDTIFDPGISNYHFSSLEPGVSHRSGNFIKFNESPMEISFSTCSPMDQ
nr:hypothetical protein [Tanacetum cinerariifolium]